MEPTGNYALFETCEELGKTAREVLTGAPGAMMQMELYLWSQYRLARARLQQQNAPRK
jgi:hypothetical protein